MTVFVSLQELLIKTAMTVAVLIKEHVKQIEGLQC